LNFIITKLEQQIACGLNKLASIHYTAYTPPPANSKIFTQPLCVLDMALICILHIPNTKLRFHIIIISCQYLDLTDIGSIPSSISSSRRASVDIVLEADNNAEESRHRSFKPRNLKKRRGPGNCFEQGVRFDLYRIDLLRPENKISYARTVPACLKLL